MTPNVNPYLPFTPYSAYLPMSPEYQAGYENGFTAGKRAAMQEIATALKIIKNKEPFTTHTATATIPSPTVEK